MANIQVWMAKYENTLQLLTLYLYDDTGAIVNTGGDELAEVTNGLFQSTVNESLSGKLRAVVKGGTEPIWEGWLHDKTTVCTETDVVDAIVVHNL